MKRLLTIATALLFTAGFAFAGGGGESKPSPSPSPAAGSAKPGWEFLEMGRKDDAAGILPAVNPIKVKGNIVTAGSSTVFPLAEVIADRFKKEGYSASNGTISIDSIGSGAGRERYIKGEIDIANASSPIKAAELETAKSNGLTTLEFKIGTDALAVVVNKNNTFIKDASVADLAKIFTAEKWSDVNPSWPSETILRFIPGTDSGTFEYFVEAVFKNNKEPLLNAPNTQKSEDDNVLVRGVEGSPYAVGFFGFAYYLEEKSRLNILNIAGIEPNEANVNAAKYPLARPLFMYTAVETLKAKPQIAAYINYFLTFVNQEIGKVGYFKAPETVLNTAKQTWVDSLKDLLK